MDDAVPSFKDRLLDNLCQFDFLIYMAFVVEILLLIAATLSYLFGDLDRETRAILMLDFALLGVVFSLTVTAIYVCSRRT